jgi:hypothetical protein
MTWPAAIVIVALVAGCTATAVVEQRHADDGAVACARSGGEWQRSLFSERCVRR